MDMCGCFFVTEMGASVPRRLCILLRQDCRFTNDKIYTRIPTWRCYYYFQCHNLWKYIIWTTVRASEKCSNNNTPFLEVDVSHRTDCAVATVHHNLDLYFQGHNFRKYVTIYYLEERWELAKNAQVRLLLRSNGDFVNVVHRNLDLYFEDHNFLNYILYNIWKTVRASEKCSSTFIEVGIC